MSNVKIDEMEQSGFYTYLLNCADGSLYCGWAIDPQQRLERHNAGKGAKYTRLRLPVRLVAQWRFETKGEAMRFEYQIKRLSRQQKLALIEGQFK
jgi:putative endonuclease